MTRLDGLVAAMLMAAMAFIAGYARGLYRASSEPPAVVTVVAPAPPDKARVMLDVMRCESGFRHDAVGDDGVSRGIAQFRKETFYEFAEMAKKQGKWRFGKPRWTDPQQQVFLLEWGLDNGYGRRWTCYRGMKK